MHLRSVREVSLFRKSCLTSCIGWSKLGIDIMISEVGVWMISLDGGSDPGFLVCDVIVVVLSNANDVGSIISLLIDDTAVSDEAH